MLYSKTKLLMTIIIIVSNKQGLSGAYTSGLFFISRLKLCAAFSGEVIIKLFDAAVRAFVKS